VQQAFHVPNFFTKVNLLTHLLQNNEDMSKVLVFVASKQLADKLHEKMSAILEDNVGVIHSNKSQNQRFNTIERFENGTLRMLIATDIIARGLDIKDVTHVINFDTPENATSYIHRIGRTGRADKTGVAITFINEVEQTYQIEIEDMMQKLIPVMPLPKEVEISNIFTDDEKPQFLGDKNYLKQHKKTHSQGAFHEKKEKNAKVNLGGSYKRKLKEKYKKPLTKGGSKRKK
jgi:ATP-dependent RNA helicase RhlE